MYEIDDNINSAGPADKKENMKLWLFMLFWFLWGLLEGSCG